MLSFWGYLKGERRIFYRKTLIEWLISAFCDLPLPPPKEGVLYGRFFQKNVGCSPPLAGCVKITILSTFDIIINH